MAFIVCYRTGSSTKNYTSEKFKIQSALSMYFKIIKTGIYDTYERAKLR
jgi:hypothetical protein